MENLFSRLMYILSISSQPLTADELGTLLNVSQRTIRNYIDQINKDNTIVLKNSTGYFLNNYNSFEYNFDIENIDSPMERRKKILIDLLQGNDDIEKDYLNKYYISDATFTADIQYLKNKIAPYDAQIIIKNNRILLLGEEGEKRKIISLMILYNDYDFEVQSKYENADELINEFKFQLITLFNDLSFKTNDFTFRYILNHLLVILIRTKNHNYLSNYEHQQYPDRIETIAKEIKKLVSNIFQLPVKDNEYYYIQQILNSVKLDDDWKFEDDNQQDIFKRVIEDIITKTSEKYQVDIDDNIFVTHFYQHLKNLYFRSINKVNIDNPMAVVSKNEFPLIHDISVYISHIIEEQLQIHINENEISFISFHIGAYLNTFNKENKINFAFIYQEYNQFYQNQIDFIQKYFDNELNLAYIASSKNYQPNELKNNYIDLVITTDYSFKMNDIPILHIAPIMNSEYKDQISNKIKEIQSKKRKEYIRKYFFSILKEELFFTDIPTINETDTIQFMGDKLIKLNYIDSNFMDDTLKREGISSTSFIEGLAMPHTLSVDAKKSFFSIVINKKPIKWKDSEVRVVIMIGIEEQNKYEFRESFEILTKLLTEPKVLSQLLNCKTYNDLIEYFKEKFD